MRPKKTLCLHFHVAVAVLVGVLALVDAVGADVIECVDVEECLSLQPKNRPGVSQVEGAAVLLALLWEVVDEGAGSLQPNQPSVSHVVDGDDERDLSSEVVVTALVVGGTVVVVTVIFFDSLQPNQPGVKHVVVVYVVVTTGVVVVADAVVDSSRHPHHPGVLQVVVLVRVEVEVVGVDVVVFSDPLLLKYFQLKQSTHSSSGMHSGTLGYFRITLSITL